MIFADLYHCLKPLIPRRLQIGLRRRVALARRSNCSDIWPIDASAGKQPKGWAGWPEGKKFAFVLTHDVEGPRGVERCQKLANLDYNEGFRSCFNFVPDSCEAAVPLYPNLIARGSEIGVHGLLHDGNLFSSRKKFVRMAAGIDKYLKDWQSVGFRTPSMYHNLGWIGELGIEYDSSTFDTDPFEPQPDGMGTIFPFWVPASSTAKGFVELPYTLPQDFTLFVIMKEKNIATWKRKLDWVAEKGGMALLITHPDYMNFGNDSCGVEEYPVEYYETLLNYVKTKYEGQYWHALPREVARFWRESLQRCAEAQKQK